MKRPCVYIMASKRNDEAIAREKQIKAGSRANKLALIEGDNPDWTDLYENLNAYRARDAHRQYRRRHRERQRSDPDEAKRTEHSAL